MRWVNCVLPNVNKIDKRACYEPMCDNTNIWIHTVYQSIQYRCPSGPQGFGSCNVDEFIWQNPIFAILTCTHSNGSELCCNYLCVNFCFPKTTCILNDIVCSMLAYLLHTLPFTPTHHVYLSYVLFPCWSFQLNTHEPSNTARLWAPTDRSSITIQRIHPRRVS